MGERPEDERGEAGGEGAEGEDVEASAGVGEVRRDDTSEDPACVEHGEDVEGNAWRDTVGRCVRDDVEIGNEKPCGAGQM